MNLVYIANARIPTEKAHGLQIMKMSEAFSKLSNFKLILPKRVNRISINEFEYYDIKNKFKIQKLNCLDFMFLHKFPFKGHFIYFLRTFIYSLRLLFNSSVKNADVIYTRDIFSTFFLSLIKKNIYYEMHDFPKSKIWLNEIYLKRIRGVITTNNWKKDKLIEIFGFNEEKVIALPNAIDLEYFNHMPDKQKMRDKYKLPSNRVIVSYIGKFYTMNMTKGINLFLKAFNEARKENPKLYLVCAGYSGEETKLFEKEVRKLDLTNDVSLLEQVPYKQVKEYYALADIFVLPYPKTDHYNFFMCPLKLFEYVASKKPIIASDLNSVREIFNDQEVMYFEPGNVIDLKNKILSLVDINKQNELISKAYNKLKGMSWNWRADKIINIIN